MIKVIEGLIKILSNDKLWSLIGIIVNLLDKRGETIMSEEEKARIKDRIQAMYKK